MSGAASTRPEDIVGEALPGGYRVDRYLASGGFAWIFQARDPRGQTCAVKIPYEITRLTLRLFEREIKVMRSLPPSPYRVAYVGDGLTFKGVPFLAMEYVDGPTLRHVLAATPMWTIEDSCNFMLQLCAACADLHHLGIADRDLKPDNVLLTSEWQVKLVDFGLVKDAQGLLKLFEAEDILQGRHFAENLEGGMIAGSPEWIAPEQFSDASVDEALAQTDTWTDVYAMGLIFHRLLTGRAVFPFKPQSRDQGEYARELLAYLNHRATIRDDQLRRPAEIPEALWAVITRALRTDPRGRQRDAIVLGQEIEHFLATGEAIEPFDDEKTTLGNAAQFLAAHAKPRSVPPSRPPPALSPPVDFSPRVEEEEESATAIAVLGDLEREHTPPDARAIRASHQPISGKHRIPNIEKGLAPVVAGPPTRPARPIAIEPTRRDASRPVPIERIAPLPAAVPAPVEMEPLPGPQSQRPQAAPTLVLVVLVVLGLFAVGAVSALVATMLAK